METLKAAAVLLSAGLIILGAVLFYNHALEQDRSYNVDSLFLGESVETVRINPETAALTGLIAIGGAVSLFAVSRGGAPVVRAVAYIANVAFLVAGIVFLTDGRGLERVVGVGLAGAAIVNLVALALGGRTATAAVQREDAGR